MFLSLLAYKNRALADYCYRLEILSRFVSVLHLNFANYNKDYINVLAWSILNYLMFSIGFRYELFMLVFTIAWGLFIGINIAYVRPFTS